ncbi:TetR/AcrR family transcriptional regulator [Euzebya tangerina]|uniref:TetR/AcrR family transcriptional regulator n=1 Tax=Euzebya tangerina TaxID=591198 RepID=UPI000E3222CC|nr:TetR/AcrR family transcriptional regulator [Euzebya tangerina]
MKLSAIPFTTMARMTAGERRDQLIGVAKETFAELGYDGASVEEIAARAGVSKPVVYEHFGGKEGIYAVVVDREATRLLDKISAYIDDKNGGRQIINASALAFLHYIEEDPAAFRVLTRDSPASVTTPGIAGLLSDVADKAAGVLAAFFDRSGLDPATAPLYAGALVGMVAYVGSWWATAREPSAEEVAQHITALAYHGLRDLPHHPAGGSSPSS